MVFCSPNPPFFVDEPAGIRIGIGFETNFRDYIENLLKIFDVLKKTVLKEDGCLFLHAGDYSTTHGSMLQTPERLAISMCDRLKWILRSKIVWWRPDKSIQNTNNRFKRDWEYLYFFTQIPDGYLFKKEWNTSVFKIPYVLPPPSNTWDSGFPEELIRIAIKTTTEEGQTVLDPFVGTGATGIAALKMKRNFIGIDISESKIKRTTDRLSKIA